MDKIDTVVVGAGVVGLAVARALALQGREVLVLEATAQIGSATSSRNSEVIHAGLYYPSGSLKAALCLRGRDLLYAYCAGRGVGHRRCGKLIVATHPSQLAKLHAIAEQAARHGVDDVAWLSAEAAHAREPALHCIAALHSPSTGIIDSHGLMMALWADLEQAGGLVAFNAPLVCATPTSAGWHLQTADGTELLARQWVNAAGLQAPALARSIQATPRQLWPQAYFAKGNYFTLSGRAPFSHLIYPVPEAAGLGVHLTLDLGGQAKFGPDVQWVEGPDDLQVDPARVAGLAEEVRAYWPGLPEAALQPGYAGIRPKISGPGAPAADFAIWGPSDHGLPDTVQLFGIESPGLTSCLAVGDHVAALLEQG